MDDDQDANSALIVVLTYRVGTGAVVPIAIGVAGQTSYQWTVPSDVESSAVTIIAVVTDTGMLTGTDNSPQFEIFANKPPTIAVTTPPRLKQGDPYDIVWTMNDLETAIAQLVVYLNYSYGGNTYPIAGPLVGLTAHAWTVPMVERTDVKINATVMDSDGLKNWSSTEYFEIFREVVNTPPIISITDPPASLEQGSTYTIVWTMADTETSASNLVVYVNYSWGGSTYAIVGPLVGLTSHEWTVPMIEAVDVNISATVIDEGDLTVSDETSQFEIFADESPTIFVTYPVRLGAGATYTITWTMGDDRTTSGNLIVYLNLSYGGNNYAIAGPLVGLSSFEWTVPSIRRTDVRINATVIDDGDHMGWNTTLEFEIFEEVVDHPAEQYAWLWLSAIGVVTAVIILLLLMRRKRRTSEAEESHAELVTKDAVGGKKIPQKVREESRNSILPSSGQHQKEKSAGGDEGGLDPDARDSSDYVER
jgi:hypothetical protein